MIRISLLLVISAVSSARAMVSPGYNRKELISSGTLCTLVRTVSGKKYIPKDLVVKVKDENIGKTTYWVWNDVGEVECGNVKIKIETGFRKICLSHDDTFIDLAFDKENPLKSEKIVAPDNTIWYFEHPYNPKKFSSVSGYWVQDEPIGSNSL